MIMKLQFKWVSQRASKAWRPSATTPLHTTVFTFPGQKLFWGLQAAAQGTKSEASKQWISNYTKHQ